MTDSQILLETEFPWDVVVHDAFHEAFMNQFTNFVVMTFVHEHDIEKYVHENCS